MELKEEILKPMTTEELVEFFEKNKFNVSLFEQDGVQCGELEMWTDGGVDMVIYLNPFTLDEFIEYVNDFDVDEEIKNYSNDKLYASNFTFLESVNDFTSFHENLKRIIFEKSKEEKIKDLVVEILDEVNEAMKKKIDELFASRVINVDDWDEKYAPMLKPKIIVCALLDHESKQYSLPQSLAIDKKIKEEIKRLKYFL